ncbi:MAG TPA: hypothetical protein VGG14_11910 [Candidatus Sulfotelmatobacter sp.]|jgi:hypothetical protein
MPEEVHGPPRPQVPPATPPTKGPTINIGEEFGTAKHNLPPVRILLAAVAAVVIIVAIVAFLQRAKPQAAGTIVHVAGVQIPGQNAVLVALTFSLRNPGEKSLWVHDVKGKLVSSGGEQTADAVSAIDFDRYYTAFPELKVGTQPALSPEDKLHPGEQVMRTVIVSFPVMIDAFNQRKSVSVVIQPYDQPVPVVLTN